MEGKPCATCRQYAAALAAADLAAEQPPPHACGVCDPPHPPNRTQKGPIKLNPFLRAPNRGYLRLGAFVGGETHERVAGNIMDSRAILRMDAGFHTGMVLWAYQK